MTAPEISVFIASYNHGRFLPQTLDSVLGQQAPDFEIVVVDDGSTDDSREVLERYASRDSRVRWSQHPGGVNLGVSRTSNRAIESCRGRFLAWMGSDDLLAPGSLARRHAVLRRSSRVAMVYGRARVLEKHRDPPRELGANVNRAQPPVARLALSNCVPASTVMLRKSALERHGAFAESLVSSDWELWLRLLSNSTAVFVPEVFASHRVHDANLNALLDRAESSARSAAALDEAVARAPETGGAIATAGMRNLLDLQRAYHWFAAGQESKATEALAEVSARASDEAGSEHFDRWLRHLPSLEAAAEFLDWTEGEGAAARWPDTLQRRVRRLGPALPSLIAAWRHRREGALGPARRCFFAAVRHRPSLLKDPTIRRFAGAYLLRR